MDVLYVKIEILESQNETFKSENTTLKSENSMLKMLLKENIAFTNRIVEILAKMDVLLDNKRHMSHSNESHDIQNVIPDVKMDVQNLEETSNGVKPFENQNPDFGTDATAPRPHANHLDVEIGSKEADKMDFSDQQPSETNHVTTMSHPNESSHHDLGGIDLNGLEDFDIDLPALTCGTGITQMKDESYQYNQIEPMTPPSEPAPQRNEQLHEAPPSGEITQQVQTVVNIEQWQNIPLENTEVAQFKEEYQQYGQHPMTPPCESLVPPCDGSSVPLSEPNNRPKPESAKKVAKTSKGPSRKKQKIEHDNPYFAQNDHGYFICPYDTCTTTMKHRHALVEHIRIHTGEKPFKCAICSKRFRCAGTIRKHLKTVHKSDMASQRFQEVTRLSLQMTSSASDNLQ